MVADAALGGTDKTKHQLPGHTRLYRHLLKICMPLIEWTCVAGLPTLVCIKIVGLHISKIILCSALLSVEATHAGVGGVSSKKGGNGCEYNESLQCSLLLLATASILSLVAILFFGDATENDCRHIHNTHKRGFGIVMGSHLVPLLYMSMQLSLSCGGHNINIEFDDNNISCPSWEETRQTNDNNSCSDVAKENYGNYEVGSGLHHLRFASVSGLAFAISSLSIKWSQCNHRKCNSKRRNGTLFDVRGQNGDHINGNRCKNDKSEHAATVMSFCWKAYSGLMIFQSAISSYEVYTPILGILHILLILAYDQRKATTLMIPQGERTVIQVQAAWQDAFTPGEWMVVSTLITSLVGEYLLEHSGILLYSFNANAGGTTSSLHNYSLPIHLVVAHAGLVGCLVGAAICSFLKKSLPLSIYRSRIKMKIGMVISLVTVAGITVGSLEIALKTTSLNNSDTCSDIESTCAYLNSSNDWIPLSVQWIVHFLLSKIDVPSNDGSASVLRGGVLGYWALVLALCLTIATMLPSWITARKNESKIVDANTNNGANDGCRNHKNRVIIARKYFHLVAILLFIPITWLDPDMMALSYAIAISLLIALEMVRGWTCVDDGSANTGAAEITEFYMVFLDEKDSSAAKGGLAVTHIALLVGCAFPLWVNQFLQQTMSVAGESLLQSPTGTLSFSDEVLMPLLPFLGVLVLGIGDSAGAIGGINFGRHRWPGGSSRTLEGSLCMFLCMMLVILSTGTNGAIGKYAHYTLQASLPMGVLTLVEASTTQIDNLCLPITGSTMLVLMSTLV